MLHEVLSVFLKRKISGGKNYIVKSVTRFYIII